MTHTKTERKSNAQSKGHRKYPIRTLPNRRSFGAIPAEAIADGVLIDATKLAGEAGFRYPVALTAAAWHDCVAVASTDHVHDETGRLWDVLNVLRYVVKMNPDSSEIRFCVDVADENEHVTRVWLKCQCGFGDDPAC